MDTLKDDLINNYSKFPAEYFAKKYNKTVRYISTRASQVGAADKRRKERKCFENQIIEDYMVNKETIEFISKKYKLGLHFVTTVIKKYAKTRNRREAAKTKYTCNENVFEKIDTPEKAYWFGFIAADGCLCRGALQITLQKRDEHHLESLKSFMGYNGPLYNANNGNGRCLNIVRKKIYDDLISLGIEKNKTFKINEKLFDQIPERFIPAAILGYFDGDGCFYISYRQKKRAYLRMSLVGNESFLYMVKDKLEKLNFFCPNPLKIKKCEKTFELKVRVSGEKAKLLYDIFYGGEFSSKTFLERKKEKLMIIYDREPA